MDELIKELSSALEIFEQTQEALDEAETEDDLDVPNELYYSRDDAGVDVARVAARLHKEIGSGRVALVNGQALANLLAAHEDVGRDVRELADALTRKQ